MNTPERFPLFYLPMLALMEVLKMMAPVDQFTFASLSKKAKALLKKPLHLELKVRGNYLNELNVIHSKSSKIFLKTTVKFKLETFEPTFSLKIDKVPVFIKHLDAKTMTSYWKIREHGFQNIGKLLAKNFCIPDLHVNVEHPETVDTKTLDVIQNIRAALKIPIGKFHVLPGRIYKQNLRPLLDKFSNSAQFILECVTTFYFEYTHTRQYSRDYIRIDHAHWFDDEPILLLKCKRVKMNDVVFTSQEWNEFFKEWKKGGNRIEEMEFSGVLVGFMTALHGLNVQKMDKIVKFGNEKKTADHAYSLQQDNSNQRLGIYQFDKDILVRNLKMD